MHDVLGPSLSLVVILVVICFSDEGDSQQHMFNCVVLKISNSNIKYEDIFSLDLQKLISVAKLCESIARKRAELLE